MGSTEIGFNFDAYPEQLVYLKRYGVSPIIHLPHERMPRGSKEPEAKILLPYPRCFGEIRALISSSENGFLIPGQIYSQKRPLVSTILDTVGSDGIAPAYISAGNHSLRFEVNPYASALEMLTPDWNEKSSMRHSNIIGGTTDRDERERRMWHSESLEEGYAEFVKMYRNLGNPTFCDTIPFSSLHVLAGYIAARTEIGIAIKHPQYPVIFVFEACEDRFDCLHPDMTISTVELYEYEFEPKQVIGELPKSARSKEGFKYFLYSFMTDFRDHICRNINGAQVNEVSKAEIAIDHLANLYGQTDLAEIFKGSSYTPERLLLSLSRTLKEVLTEAAYPIYKRAARLHHGKLVSNEGFITAERRGVGYGNGHSIPFYN